MAYYVTGYIGLDKDEEGKFESLEEAKTERARLDADAIADGHEPGFWIIIDEEGKEVSWQ